MIVSGGVPWSYSGWKLKCNTHFNFHMRYHSIFPTWISWYSLKARTVRENKFPRTVRPFIFPTMLFLQNEEAYSLSPLDIPLVVDCHHLLFVSLVSTICSLSMKAKESLTNGFYSQRVTYRHSPAVEAVQCESTCGVHTSSIQLTPISISCDVIVSWCFAAFLHLFNTSLTHTHLFNTSIHYHLL